MTRNARFMFAALAAIGMATMLLLIFLAWRQGGLALLQLDISLC